MNPISHSSISRKLETCSVTKDEPQTKAGKLRLGLCQAVQNSTLYDPLFLKQIIMACFLSQVMSGAALDIKHLI